MFPIVQSNFVYHFLPGNVQIPVYAGLYPVDHRVVDIIRPADLLIYFNGQTSSLLSNTKYAINIPFDGCNDNCTSLLLPGGVELARQYGPFLNDSIFEGGVFNNFDALRIDNALGRILTFQTLPEDFFFNRSLYSSDCTYAGSAINNSLQLCMRQVDNSLAVGWFPNRPVI